MSAWRRADVELDDLFVEAEFDSLIWKVVGLIDEPVVVLVPADERDGEDRVHIVISSSQFAKYDKLVRTPPPP